MTLPTEAELHAIKVTNGERYSYYKDGRITAMYRSVSKDFPPLADGSPDHMAAELWVRQQNVPEHPVETEIAGYFEEPT